MRYIPNQEILTQRFATQRNFTLPRLFDGGFQGIVFDPLNIATLFQDSAGTTPVTTPGDPVARVLDLSGNGHHATQTTDSSRMTYGVVPKGGRRNLVPNSIIPATVGVVGSGGTYGPSLSLRGLVAEVLSVTSEVFGNEITLKISGTPSESGSCSIDMHSGIVGGSGSQTASAFIQRTAGSFANTGSIQILRTNASPQISSFPTAQQLTDGVRAVASGSALGSGVLRWSFFATGGAVDFTIKFSRPQVEVGSSVTNYQRVTTAFDITESGVQSCPYLQPDGVDDWLVTPNINFSGTDAVTVFGAVRCLSDANIGTLLELSTNSSTTNGTFALLDRGNANPSVSWRSRGNVENVIDITRGAAPISSVYAAQGRISTDFSTLRRNGVEIGSSTADQGAGNFANAPLYIGRRNGTTNAFNGQIFGLAVVGKLASAEEIRLAQRELIKRTPQATLA
jgi:hypothetical protein